MSSDFHQLPIVPASNSLASHVQALDLLAARLATLSSRSEWETRIPINSKAWIDGRIVNTANVKINIGGEWWVDMTPQEAEAWVRRRKDALLEEHAKVLEGWRPGQPAAEADTRATKPESQSTSGFDPLFRSPAAVVRPASSEVPQNQPSTAQQPPVAPKAESAAPGKPRGAVSSASLSAIPPTGTPQTIEDVLNTFMQKQETLAKATGKTSMPNGNAADAMVNEEGLPIHEIREDENGQLIGDLPVTESASISAVDDAPEEEVTEVKNEDFYTEQAAARRAALRRKVFDDPSDSDSESDVDDHELTPAVRQASSSTSAIITSAASAAAPAGAPPSINAIPPTPSSPHGPTSPPAPVRRSSSSAPMPGKSILKPAASRKKSVSFDSSIPDSPDSPAPPSGPGTRIGGSVFPTPVINIDSGIEEKKVPVLNAPKPKVPSPNRSTFGDPFAGFKPGFLSGGGNKASPTVIAEPQVIAQPKATDPEPAAEVKKPSLFAQRQRDTPAEDASAPAFPAMSASKGTSSVKNAVFEKPPPPAQPKAKAQGQTAGVAQSVMERSTEPVAGPSRLNGHIAEQDDEEEDEDDDDDFYRDDDDDDEEAEEYDLDDAMMAREVALAYHQNRAFTELGRPRGRTDPEGDEEYEGGYEYDGEEGGVVLGLPEISVLGPDGLPGTGAGGGGGQPRIINPTPDNLRRFVRVGKLDNGKFVLAPGESGWSDEEGEGDGDEVKRGNAEDVRRALLGQQPQRMQPRQQQPSRKHEVEEDMGIPPVIGISAAVATTSSSTPGSGGVKERVAESGVPEVQVADAPAPKKVSRFKANRMGNA